MVDNPLQVVGAVISSRVGNEPAFLAFRRGPHRAAAGQWEFPGGKVEAEETPQAALVREIEEELGVTGDVGALITRDVTRVGSRHIDLACYWFVPDEYPTASSDHDEIQWVPIHELRSLTWAEPDIPALEVLERMVG